MKKLLAIAFSLLLPLCAVNAQMVPGSGRAMVPVAGPFSLSQLIPAGSGDVAPSGLSIALCLKRCVSTYAGPLVTVVRASDSATLNIPQDALGNLDQSMCAAFQGASTLTVSVWFDQTINGNNAVQATGANQPTLVCSVPQLAGLPAINWGAACGTTLLQVPTAPSWNGFAAGANPGTILDTEFFTATTVGCTIRRWEVGTTVDPNALHSLIPGGASTIRFSTGYSTSNGNFITTQSVGTTLANVVDFQYQWTLTTNLPIITINGGPATLGTSTAPVGTAGNDTSKALNIGNGTTGNSLSFPGYMTTLMLWKSGPGATQLEAARKVEGNYYGIAVQ